MRDRNEDNERLGDLQAAVGTLELICRLRLDRPAVAFSATVAACQKRLGQLFSTLVPRAVSVNAYDYGIPCGDAPANGRICMYVCLSVYMYVCTYACIYVCMYVYAHIYICKYKHANRCLWTFVYIHTHTYTYNISTDVYEYAYAVHIQIHECMHTCMHACTHA